MGRSGRSDSIYYPIYSVFSARALEKDQPILEFSQPSWSFFLTVQMMSENRLRLSASEMRNILQARVENNFTFIVDENCYSFAWFIAAFLSPKFDRLHSIDGTVQELPTETNDTKNQFIELPSVASGSRVDLNGKNFLSHRFPPNFAIEHSIFL
jgi:hypothetical protein